MAFRKVANVSVRCHKESRIAFDTNVPFSNFIPKRGKVEKKVSSTLFISSLAFMFWLATFNTMGVNFLGVNIKFMEKAITAERKTINAPSVIPVILNNFFVRFFILTLF